MWEKFPKISCLFGNGIVVCGCLRGFARGLIKMIEFYDKLLYTILCKAFDQDKYVQITFYQGEMIMD